MNTPQVRAVPIEEPHDEYERELLRRITELQREYEAQAKPYIDALVNSRSLKLPRWALLIDPLPSEGQPQ